MENDVTGQRFGRLVAIERLPGTRPNYRTKYLCKCDCGIEKLITYNDMSTGKTKSCGCLRKEAPWFIRASAETIMINRKWAAYRDKVRTKGITFTLLKNEFAELVTASCHYCGYHNPTLGVGIDRVDNSKGYESGNSVSCCKHCNYGKRDRSREEFLAWVTRIIEHQEMLLWHQESGSPPITISDMQISSNTATDLLKM